jgi:hypothetical protein
LANGISPRTVPDRIPWIFVFLYFPIFFLSWIWLSQISALEFYKFFKLLIRMKFKKTEKFSAEKPLILSLSFKLSIKLSANTTLGKFGSYCYSLFSPSLPVRRTKIWLGKFKKVEKIKISIIYLFSIIVVYFAYKLFYFN